MARKNDLRDVLMTCALLSHSEHKADSVPSMRAFLSDVAKQIKKDPDPFLQALGGVPIAVSVEGGKTKAWRFPKLLRSVTMPEGSD